MARGAGYGLVGLSIVFLGLLLVLPYLKSLFPTISGFEDLSCEEGKKPCPEGYFCQQRSCVPILPKYNINAVEGKEDY